MKKVFTFFAAVLLMASVFAQSPEKMSYQAVIRNSSDVLVTDTQVGMQISILQDTEDGSPVYVETQTPTTNANGLVSIEIGAGTVVSGDFSTIDWANGPYYIKTETDPAGSTDYTITGTSQLLSVPYALHAKTAENGITTEQADAIAANTAKVSAITGTQSGEMQYWDGTAWVTVVAATNEGATLQMIGGVPTWTGGTPSAGEGEVLNPATNKVWMDRNLGASQVAVSVDDADAYGDIYQWGRAADGHQLRSSVAVPTLSDTDAPGHGDFIQTGNYPDDPDYPYDWRSSQNDNLWQGVDGINNPCPAGFRLPTEAEWAAEIAEFSTADKDGAFDSPLKLTTGGMRYRWGGAEAQVGNFGQYWSSTVDGYKAKYLNFHSIAVVDVSWRSMGFSVRCIKD
jgi:uncharacterized protein (TIGR02145 family)